MHDQPGDGCLIDELLELQSRVGAICERVGSPLASGAPGASPEVLFLARRGDHRRAARLHVEQTGCDPLAAQRIVEAL